MSAVAGVVEVLLRLNGVKAVKYLAPNQVVRAVRRRAGGKIDNRDRNITISLTLGRPNYAERLAIAKCVKAKESFPIKLIRVKYNNAQVKTPKPHGRKKRK